jgi:hypothetical protein
LRGRTGECNGHGFLTFVKEIDICLRTVGTEEEKEEKEEEEVSQRVRVLKKQKKTCMTLRGAW